jgi:signal transduction histidine kinase
MKVKAIFLQCILCIGLCAFHFNLDAQDTYTLKHLKQGDGLTQNTVSSIYFSANGFLWFTTEDGIIRYDGAKMFVYNSAQNESILNDRFRNIIPSITGNVYTQSSDSKFFEIANNKLNPLGQKHNLGSQITGILPQKEVFDNFSEKFLFKDSNQWGIVFPYQIFAFDTFNFMVLSRKNILVFNQTTLKQQISLPGHGKYAIFQIDSNYYIGSDNGTIYYINLTKRKLEKCELLCNKMVEANLYKGNFFFNAAQRNTYLLGNKNVYNLSIQNNPQSISINYVLPLPIDRSYIITIASNISGNEIALGTINNGIYVYRKALFSNLDINPNFSNPYNAITIFNKGILSTKQHFFKDNLAQLYPIYPKSIDINSIYTHNNFIWFSYKTNLFKFDTLTKKTKLLYSFSKDVSCINGRGDSLFVGTNSEFSYFFKDSFCALYNSNTLPKNGITAINFSPNGAIFFSNCVGLFKVIGIHSQKLFVKDQGINACVRDIIFHKELMFLCTYGKGIIVKHKGEYRKLNIDINAFLSKSHSLQIDKNEHLWISTNNGIFETKMALIYAYLADTSKYVLYNRYGTAFGMRTAEFNGGCYPSSAQDSTGNIFFPSIQGIVRFNSLNLAHAIELNPIYIDQIYLNRLPIPSSDTIVYVSTDVESIKIKLLTSQWLNQADFEYQLIGYNKNPIRLLEADDVISFTNLPAGEYVLNIKNIVGLNPSRYPQKQIRIIVAKHYYETTWFQLLIIVFLGGLIFAVNLWNRKMLLKRNQTLEQTIHNSTDELKKTNEVLSQANLELNQSVNVKNKLISIISHDIITPIKFMAIAAKNTFKKDSNEELSQTLYDIQQTANRLHDNAQNVLNWIKYQNNLIEAKKTNIALYPLVEDLCDLLHDAAKANNNIIINEIEPDEIILSDGVILGILIHNLLSNAVKYVKNGQINISFEKVNNQPVLTVADTGMGMSPSHFKRVKSIISKTNTALIYDSANGNALGYIIISELASLLFAEIIVLNEVGKGVTVKLIIP